MRNTDHIILEDRAVPLLLPWPLPGNPGGIIEIAKTDDWRAVVGGLGIDPRIPDIVAPNMIAPRRCICSAGSTSG